MTLCEYSLKNVETQKVRPSRVFSVPLNRSHSTTNARHTTNQSNVGTLLNGPQTRQSTTTIRTTPINGVLVPHAPQTLSNGVQLSHGYCCDNSSCNRAVVSNPIPQNAQPPPQQHQSNVLNPMPQIPQFQIQCQSNADQYWSCQSCAFPNSTQAASCLICSTPQFVHPHVGSNNNSMHPVQSAFGSAAPPPQAPLSVYVTPKQTNSANLRQYAASNTTNTVTQQKQGSGNGLIANSTNQNNGLDQGQYVLLWQFLDNDSLWKDLSSTVAAKLDTLPFNGSTHYSYGQWTYTVTRKWFDEAIQTNNSTQNQRDLRRILWHRKSGKRVVWQSFNRYNQLVSLDADIMLNLMTLPISRTLQFHRRYQGNRIMFIITKQDAATCIARNEYDGAQRVCRLKLIDSDAMDNGWTSKGMFSYYFKVQHLSNLSAKYHVCNVHQPGQ